MKNIKLNKILWFLTSFIAFCAGIIGVINSNLYTNLIPPEFVPGATPQDILIIVVALAMMVLIPTINKGDIKKQSIVIGIIGSFFYLYGIFVIERVYNLAYYLYLAIFSLASWSILMSIKNMDDYRIVNFKLNQHVKKVNLVFSILIGLLFTVLWAIALYPLILAGERINFLYSIYILDLCFIMPAFFITAYLNLKNNPISLVTTPALFILGFFVIFPLGLVELNKPSFGLAINSISMMMSFTLAGIFLILAAINLLATKKTKR